VTRIAVHAAPGRARLRLTDGPIGVRVLHTDARGARVGLVATTALLLGGDHIEIRVEVGPGAWLEVVETAGTVAYDAGGVASSWTVRISIGESGTLIWAGEPFVVAAGANVRRRSTVDLAEGAVACLRDTVVLGRSGEVGGSLVTTSWVHRDGVLLLADTLDLSDPHNREHPGIVGEASVIDTVGLLGTRAPAAPAPAAGERFDLDGPGTLARCLATGYADSPLHQVMAAWSAAAGARPVRDVPEAVATEPPTHAARPPADRRTVEHPSRGEVSRAMIL
jgi:urease accessory protein